MNDFINAYVYKYGFFYVGWIVGRKKSKAVFYFDNKPVCDLYGIAEIKYLCFSLTQKAAYKKISRKFEKSEAEASLTSR